ncbi:hypothetical protein [Hymenobacter sp. APR13]|uniref:hypothetical protein n=1 Tax=Hymenobacter sp. APR13 TaxID=1356852 RepID=UPI0004E07A97|nr:hypothetical protein [Hymenobacter sp. APR13]AII50392.1 hypothetical protein N008_00140 [Hymenobacter sp. APR13]
MINERKGFGTMDIGTWDANGKLTVQKLPFHMDGTRQTNAFCDILGIEYNKLMHELAKLQQPDELTYLRTLVALIYSGIYAGTKLKRMEVQLTMDDVIDWVEYVNESGTDEMKQDLIQPLTVLLDCMQKRMGNAVG